MSDLRYDAPSNVPGMNHRKTKEPEDLGYSPEIERHLTDDEASRLLHQQNQEQVQAFIAALGMRQAVSPDTAVTFLAALFKDRIPMDDNEILVQLRLSQWEQYLDPSENLEEIAQRAYRFFETEEGLALGNFFTATIARTTDSMY